jgi:type II secretory pathway pseudopilin PulG
MEKIKMMFTKNNKVSTMSRSYTAFTLAEVLITLGIIGVVAALTIPTLMNNTNEQELITAWKKNFSMLSQAVTQIVYENTTLSICPYDGTDSARTCMRDEFLKHLTAIKVCDATNGAECFHVNNDGTKFLNNTLNTNYWGPTTSAILKDGTLLRFSVGNSNCSDLTTDCGEIWVDVNGFKKPNVVGKDIFGVGLIKNTVKPFGTAGDGYIVAGRTCIPGDTSDDNRGEPCSALYLYQK